MTSLRTWLPLALAALLMAVGVAPAHAAILGMTPDQVAKTLGDPVGDAPPIAQAKSAKLYEDTELNYYVAYSEEQKAVYLRASRKSNRFMPSDALKEIKRLEPKEDWTKAPMTDISVWAWENKTKLKRGEYDQSSSWIYLYDLRWQDLVAGKPPRSAESVPETTTTVTIPGTNPALNEKQSQMLRQMMPDTLPKMDKKQKTGSGSQGGKDPSAFNQHLRSKQPAEGGNGSGNP